jgi:hypothetical protein
MSKPDRLRIFLAIVIHFLTAAVTRQILGDSAAPDPGGI